MGDYLYVVITATVFIYTSLLIVLSVYDEESIK